MNILFVSEYFPKSNDCEVHGGAEVRAFYLSKELSLLNHNVFVLTSKERDYPKEQNIGGVKIFRPGKERDFLLGGSFGRASLLKNILQFKFDAQVDIVDSQNVLTHLVSFHLASRYRAKKIATYHDVWTGKWLKNVGSFWGILGEIGERWVLKRNWDCFVAVSNYTRNKLIKNGIDDSKIRVIKNGIDLSLIEKIKVNKEKNPTICFIGRLYPYKRVDLLLEAVALLSSKIPEVRLKVIGSGPQLKELKDLSKRLKIQNRVSFLGFIPKHKDVLANLKSSHVFSLPSEVEGSGIATIEAMALGVPFVSSNIPATVEVTKNGTGGLLFNKGNSIDLSSKIERLFNDNEFYKRSSFEAQNLSKGYDWKIIVKDLEKLYNGLI